MKHQAHKYKRVKFKTGYTIFRCVLPGCSHFIREELLKGRLSICWRCLREHIVTDTNLSKQHCDDCTIRKTEKKKEKDDMIDILVKALG